MSGRKLILGMFLTAFIVIGCFADVTAQLDKADKCMKNGCCGEAEKIYKAVLQSEGKSDSALKGAEEAYYVIHTHREHQGSPGGL